MLPPIETNCLVWAAETFRSEPPADVDFWHIATFRCAAEFGRYRANKVSTQSSKACRRIASSTNVTLMAPLQRSIRYRLIGRANWISKLARWEGLWAGRALHSPNRPQTRAMG